MDKGQPETQPTWILSRVERFYVYYHVSVWLASATALFWNKKYPPLNIRLNRLQFPVSVCQPAPESHNEHWNLRSSSVFTVGQSWWHGILAVYSNCLLLLLPLFGKKLLLSHLRIGTMKVSFCPPLLAITSTLL